MGDCPKCGTAIDVDGSPGWKGTGFTVTCPKCGVSINVDVEVSEYEYDLWCMEDEE